MIYLAERFRSCCFVATRGGRLGISYEFTELVNGIDELEKSADELQEIVQFQRFFEHPRDPKLGRALDDVGRKVSAHEQNRNLVFLLTQL